MTTIHSQSCLTLDLPPSCIAFNQRHPRFFVVGTYFLHPSATGAERGDNDERTNDETHGNDEQQKQKRTGSVILFRVEGGRDEMIRVATRSTEYAVLDIQWSPHSHTSGQGEILAVATSTGRVEFYKFTVDGLGQADLVLDGSLVVAEEALLVLSLAWHPTLSNVVGVTLSDGSVRLCRLDEGKDAGGLLVEATQTIVQKHELEAWTLAFPPPREHRGGRIDVFSGGDDAVLKFSSVNSSELNEDIDPREVNLEVSWQDRKIHQAGVTAILPLTSDLVVTGSYDDHIRLLSCPKVGRRKVLAEANLGGGVWRLKDITAPGPDALDKDENVGISVDAGGSRSPTPPHAYTILASCMHAGARVVRLCKGGGGADENPEGDEGEGVWRFEVLYQFEEHGSMNYGSDMQPCFEREREGKYGGKSKLRTVVSTSFYDKLMCLWKVALPS